MSKSTRVTRVRNRINPAQRRTPHPAPTPFIRSLLDTC